MTMLRPNVKFADDLDAKAKEYLSLLLDVFFKNAIISLGSFLRKSPYFCMRLADYYKDSPSGVTVFVSALEEDSDQYTTKVYSGGKKLFTISHQCKHHSSRKNYNLIINDLFKKDAGINSEHHYVEARWIFKSKEYRYFKADRDSMPNHVGGDQHNAVIFQYKRTGCSVWHWLKNLFNSQEPTISATIVDHG